MNAIFNMKKMKVNLFYFLILALFQSLICANTMMAMDVGLNLQDYDFSDKQVHGFFPALTAIINKNLIPLQNNLNTIKLIYTNPQEAEEQRQREFQNFADHAHRENCVAEENIGRLIDKLSSDVRLKDINLFNDFKNLFNSKGSLENQRMWIKQNLNLLFNANPTFQNILEIIRFIGISSDKNIDTIIDIKQKCIESNVLKSGEQLRELFGEIIPNGFILSKKYFEMNTLQFLGGGFRAFLSNKSRTRKDFNEIRGLIVTIPLPFEEEAQREQLVRRLNMDQRDSLVKNIELYTLERLTRRVKDLFKELEPRIVTGPETRLQYYLIRDFHKNQQVVNSRLTQGQCVACFDEITEEEEGMGCPLHDRNKLQTPMHLEDLGDRIKEAIEKRTYPVTCSTAGNDHELAIDEELLLQKKILTQEEIFKWKFGTLLSYLRALLSLKNNTDTQSEIKHCDTRGCNTLLFLKDKERNIIRCPACDVQRCVDCDQVPHEGVRCGERPRDFLPLDSRFRPCPYCKTTVEKTTGCNQVSCHCGNDFNIQLGKPRARTTFFNLHFGGERDEAAPRRYLVEGEPNYIPGSESAYPEEDGEIRPDVNIRQRGE